MAHNIATINEQDAIAYLDETPWHGLGQKLQLGQLAREAMIDAALDAAQLRYQVGSLPIYMADGTEIKGHKASVRFDPAGAVAAFLGIVGEGYTHIQNEAAVALLRVLVEEFGCVPAAAGALGDGGRAWMLIRMADATITPVPGDDSRGYFLLHWGHDGNVGLNGLLTMIRVVCQNTLNMATARGKAWINIRHTASADARLDEAAKLIRRMGEQLKTTGQTFADMARRQLSAEELAGFIARAIPNTDPGKAAVSPIIVARRDTVARLVFYGRGAALANQYADTSNGGASLWAAYNAVTEYVDHVRTAEAQSPAGLRRAQESAIFGGNAEIKAGALTLARELVAA